MNLLTHKISTQDTALLGIGGVALVLVSAITAIVWLLFATQSEQTSDLLQTLAHLKSQSAAKQRLEELLRDTQSAAARLPGFYQGTNAGTASAQLESDFKALVASNGGDIRSTQILPSKAEKGLDSLAVQYDLTVPQSHLRDLLYSVESHTPYMLITDVDISAPQNWQPTDGKTMETPLEIRWTIHGWRWSAK